MSHELDFTRGEAAIAYRGELPWHGFGESINSGDSIEDIIKKAGLDWTAEASPALYHFGNEERVAANRVILHRSDTGDFLSMVSKSNYKVRQPAEIVEFFRNMTESGGYEIEVAGALHGGRKIWCLAKRVDAAGTIGADIIKPYVLLLDSFDGSHATTGRLTSVRVVCQNTVSYSQFLDGATTAKQRHSQEFDPAKLQIQLGQFDKAFLNYIEAMQAMSKVKITDKKLERFFTRIYAPDAFEDAEKWKSSKYDLEEVSTAKKNVLADLLNLFNDNPGSNLASADGTLFGALQTVTYYQDHEARTKDNKRWESATIGAGNRIKDQAMDLALDWL
jgi:phage/plasmid-like protein (TIGR03299 family)